MRLGQKGIIQAIFFVSVLPGLSASAHAYLEELASTPTDYRTAAMGDMGLAAPSEKNAFNLFNDGNPAGSVFLEPQNRLDYSFAGQTWNGFPSSTWLRLAGTGGGYQGALLRPVSNLAVQIGTQASGYPTSYGGSQFYEGQLPHWLLSGNVSAAYAFLPGWAVGARYAYARPVRDVYQQDAKLEAGNWEAGVGYQALEERLTLGLSLGQENDNEQREVTSHWAYAMHWMNGSAETITRQDDASKYAFNQLEDQRYARLQLVFSPLSFLTLACNAKYGRFLTTSRHHQETTYTTRVDNGGDPASSYTTTSSWAYTTAGEEQKQAYDLHPALRLFIPATENTGMHIGVDYQKWSAHTSTTQSTVEQSPVITHTVYDNGAQSSTIQPLNLADLATYLRDDHSQLVEVAVALHSLEKGWLAGARYETDTMFSTVGLGAECWLFSKLALRAGLNLDTKELFDAPEVSAGVGWEDERTKLDVFYRWTSFQGQTLSQSGALGFTLIL